VAAELGDKPESAALRFSSHQDALDYARHAVEDANHRLASQSLNAVDRYRKGDVGIYINMRSRSSGHQCDLVFFRVPADARAARADYVGDPLVISDSSAEEGRWISNDERLEGTVFLGVSNLVEGPKGVIPSSVSIETSKNVPDFRGQVLASTGEVVPEFLFGGAKGKFGCFQGGALSGDSRGVAGLIEGGSQVVGGIEQNAWQHLRQLLSEFDFMKVVSWVRIFVNEAGPWLFCNETVNSFVEIANVMMCADQRQSRAAEQIRFNERPGISKGSSAPSEYAP
jgi:hypothetical protein